MLAKLDGDAHHLGLISDLAQLWPDIEQARPDFRVNH
jgi:hypothetical protein